MQRFVLITDKEMNDCLKEFNKFHDSDYTFVWCEEYCNLVDFSRNSRFDFNDSVGFVATQFKYKEWSLEEAVDFMNEKNNTYWSAFFELFHDASRKMYILCWEDSAMTD